MGILGYFQALKENKSLIMTFALGDLKNRYRNSVFGFFWSILEPLILLSVLYFVFSSLFKPGIENFAIYLLLGLIMWNFISKSTSMALQSITSRAGVLSSVYFQRAIPDRGLLPSPGGSFFRRIRGDVRRRFSRDSNASRPAQRPALANWDRHGPHSA